MLKSALFGFPLANRRQIGCLTRDYNVRLHSCELGTGCPALHHEHVVYIRPIISRSASMGILPEMAVAKGAEELLQVPQLDLKSTQEVSYFTSVCSEVISNLEVRTKVLHLVSESYSQKRSLPLAGFRLDINKGSTSLAEVAQHLANLVCRGDKAVLKDSKMDELGDLGSPVGAVHHPPRSIVRIHLRSLFDVLRLFIALSIFAALVIRRAL